MERVNWVVPSAIVEVMAGAHGDRGIKRRSHCSGATLSSLFTVRFPRTMLSVCDGQLLKMPQDVSVELVQLAEAWVNATTPSFPTTASGEDSVQVSRELYAKWVQI